MPVALTDSGAGVYDGRYTVPKETELPDEGATFELAVDLYGVALGASPCAVKVAKKVQVQRGVLLNKLTVEDLREMTKHYD